MQEHSSVELSPEYPLLITDVHHLLLVKVGIGKNNNLVFFHLILVFSAHYNKQYVQKCLPKSYNLL